jgi:uncharacterized membrane protein YdfJ with MMPL/SSD domain
MSDEFEDRLASIEEQTELIYKQNEQLLLILIQQQQSIYDMKQVINMQSQLMNQQTQQVNIILSKVSDMEINNNLMDDGIKDVAQQCDQILDKFEDVNLAIENIKVYKMITE